MKNKNKMLVQAREKEKLGSKCLKMKLTKLIIKSSKNDIICIIYLFFVTFNVNFDNPVFRIYGIKSSVATNISNKELKREQLKLINDKT